MSANLRAFLAVIRSCEGTAGENGYRTIVGGELFDSFADHPRVVRSGRFSNGKEWRSTAAGAYQFLVGTWDECARALNLPDFSPQSQDRAAVYLIQRRGALQAVEEGDLRRAIELCNREWASLPGSPYGQPTKDYATCERIFLRAGGTLSQAADGAITGATPPPPATQPVEPPASSQSDYPSIGEEPTMPLPAPALIALGAELLKVIPWGKKNAERIEEVAPVLVNIAKTVAPAGSNEQAAVEAVMRDKETQAQFVAATAVRWSDVAPFLEHDARERAAARTFAQTMTAGDGWRAIGAGMLIGVLSLTIVVGGGLLFWSMLESPQLDPGQKGLILGALLTAFTSAISFWFGSSAQSRAKDATISEQARR